MEWLNNLIMAADDAGIRGNIYNSICSLSSYLAILIGFLHGKKLKAGILVTIIAIAVERILSGPLSTLIIYVENGFTETGKLNSALAFVFVPVIGFLLSKIFKKPYKVFWDFMMPVPIVMFVGARIACTFMGCCKGYPSTWGVYNAYTGGIHFPIQLLEALVALLILIYVFLRQKKNKYCSDGRNVPIILISYGVARFFLEFFHDNDKILSFFSTMQVHCLLMIIVGYVALKMIQNSEKCEPKVNEETPNSETSHHID